MQNVRVRQMLAAEKLATAGNVRWRTCSDGAEWAALITTSKTAPKLSTNAPKMGTISTMDRIGSTLFGKT